MNPLSKIKTKKFRNDRYHSKETSLFELIDFKKRNLYTRLRKIPDVKNQRMIKEVTELLINKVKINLKKEKIMQDDYKPIDQKLIDLGLKKIRKDLKETNRKRKLKSKTLERNKYRVKVRPASDNSFDTFSNFSCSKRDSRSPDLLLMYFFFIFRDQKFILNVRSNFLLKRKFAPYP